MQKGWRIVPMARPLLPLVEDTIGIVLCQIHVVIIQEVSLEVSFETAFSLKDIKSILDNDIGHTMSPRPYLI